MIRIKLHNCCGPIKFRHPLRRATSRKKKLKSLRTTFFRLSFFRFVAHRKSFTKADSTSESWKRKEKISRVKTMAKSHSKRKKTIGNTLQCGSAVKANRKEFFFFVHPPLTTQALNWVTENCITLVRFSLFLKLKNRHRMKHGKRESGSTSIHPSLRWQQRNGTVGARGSPVGEN